VSPKGWPSAPPAAGRFERERRIASGMSPSQIPGAESGFSRSISRQSGGTTQIPNLWDDELTGALKSEARDQVTAQYGDVERQLHKQLILGQLTPAEYQARTREMMRFRAGETAAAARAVTIASKQGQQDLAIKQAELNAASQASKGGATVMRGSGEKAPGNPLDVAAAWAQKNMGASSASQLAPGDFPGNTPAGVANTFQKYFNKKTKGVNKMLNKDFAYQN